jgi:hypothetical protein
LAGRAPRSQPRPATKPRAERKPFLQKNIEPAMKA